MERTGTVKEIKDGVLVIELKQGAVCSGCGGCLSSSFACKDVMEIKDDGSGIVAGDTVELSFPRGDLLKASLLLYFLPLLLFFLAVLSANILMGYGQEVALLYGLAGLFCGFLAVKIIEPRLKRRGLMKIKVKKCSD